MFSQRNDQIFVILTSSLPKCLVNTMVNTLPYWQERCHDYQFFATMVSYKVSYFATMVRPFPKMAESLPQWMVSNLPQLAIMLPAMDLKGHAPAHLIMELIAQLSTGARCSYFGLTIHLCVWAVKADSFVCVSSKSWFICVWAVKAASFVCVSSKS